MTPTTKTRRTLALIEALAPAPWIPVWPRCESLWGAIQCDEYRGHGGDHHSGSLNWNDARFAYFTAMAKRHLEWMPPPHPEMLDPVSRWLLEPPL